MARLARFAAAFAALFLGTPAIAQTPPEASPALTQRIAELPAILRGEGDYDAYFHPGFRAQVPKDKFAAVTAQLAAAGGAVKGIEKVTPLSPDSADLAIGFANGVFAAKIAVDPAAPHQVTGLLITGFSAREATVGAVQDAIRALPGRTGYAFAKLGAGAPELLAGHQPDTPFAIGSAFKLVILAELVRATNAGERKWTDLVTLDGRPLPGGAYTQKPKGTQVSLRELAERMISVSDNSATDILLFHLGREKVEAMLPVLGVQHAARNRPFLSTLEMFKLKAVNGGALGKRWLGLNEAGRRAMLAELAAVPNSAIDDAIFTAGKPVLIDEIEWFMSANDLVRVMDWLRRNTEGPGGTDARAVLSKNPGIGAGAGKWTWVGYKGGSEPGVINMTLLLQAPNGSWYVLTGSWNNPAAAVEDGRFAGLISRWAELAAP